MLPWVPPFSWVSEQTHQATIHVLEFRSWICQSEPGPLTGSLSNLLLPICEMGIRTYFTLLLQSSHKYWTGKYMQKPKALCHYWLHSCCHRDGCCLGFSLLKQRWPQHKFPGLWLLGQRIWTSLWFLICIAQLPLELWTVTAIINSNMLFKYV